MKHSTNKIYHALGLHLHQPPGNMMTMLHHAEYEGVGVIHAYNRIVNYVHRFKDIAKIHVGISGVLIDQLTDPEVQRAYAPHIDINGMLQGYRNASNIEILGMGHFHPVFPLIPKDDWEEQLAYGRKRIIEVLNHDPEGFWPPEMAFTIEMIPAIVKAGYKYLLVDSMHLRPQKTYNSGRPDIFTAYVAEYKGYKIPVIPRNRDISNAQESGMDAGWFKNEVMHKVKENPNPDKPRLVCTWSDGENGGWFRNMDDMAGFWGHFFSPFMEQVRSEGLITPIKISEYLEQYPPVEKADIQTGAWNVGHTSGEDFSQWNGSDTQKAGVDEIAKVSRYYWELAEKLRSMPENELKEKLAHARKLILEAETSCFLFWGDSWVPKLYERTEPALNLLNEISHSI